MKIAMGFLFNVLIWFSVPFISIANILAAGLVVSVVVHLAKAILQAHKTLDIDENCRNALQKYHFQMGSDILIRDFEDGHLVYVTNLLIVMVFLKVLIFGECVMGFQSARRRHTLVIVAYIILVTMTLLLYTCFLYTVTRGREELYMGLEELLWRIRDSYEGTMGQTSITNYLNAVMHFRGCCGVRGYKDFQYKSMLEKERYLFLHGLNINLSFPVDMPLICCKGNIAFKVGEIFRNASTQDRGARVEALLRCATANSSANNKDRGCYDALWDILEPTLKNEFFVALNITCIALLVSAVALCIIGLHLRIFL